MKVIFKVALRNLFEHKAKTLIVGIMIAIEIFIMVIGNSCLDTAAVGLKKAYIENFTGHLMVIPKQEDAFSVISIMGKSGTDVGNMIAPPLPDYPQVEEYVKSLPEIEAYTPQIAALGMMGSEEKKALIAIFFGIDPEAYSKMFDSIEILKGNYLLPGEEGILCSEKTIETLTKSLGKVEIGDKVLLTNIMGMNLKIREGVIRGIYRFKDFNSLPYQAVFIDAQGLRALTGMNLGGKHEVVLDSSETGLLGFSESELFSGGDLVDSGAILVTETAADPLAELKTEKTQSIVSDTWNFILIKLKDEKTLKTVQMKMNTWFIANKIDARVQDWVIASGGLAATATQFKALLNFIIIIIAVVAVIIIINTLVISILERTPEIGMMRALGAQKKFVWKMLMTETMIIALTFGAGGIILGVIAIGIVHAIGIPTGSGFLKTVLGTGILRPEITLSGMIWPLVCVVLIGLLSQFYPAYIASRISPIKAIHAE